MSKKLLSIIIPTFNRAKYLDLLLNYLHAEIAECRVDVKIIVSNNASTDNTKEVVNSYIEKFDHFHAINHNNNIGPDENFATCVEKDNSQYFWLLGDDDLPRSGLIVNLVNILKSSTPDLVCLNDTWVSDVALSDYSKKLDKINKLHLSRLHFAKLVNARFTFISVIVVRRATYVENIDAKQLRKYSNSSLIHLGWLLPSLRLGDKFIFIKDKCIFATAANSGGYNIIKVFCQTLPRVVKMELGESSSITSAILLRSRLRVAISIAWALRKGSAGNFSIKENKGLINSNNLPYIDYFLISAIVKSSILVSIFSRAVCIFMYASILLVDKGLAILIDKFNRKKF